MPHKKKKKKKKIEHPMPDPVKPSFVISDIRAL